MGAREVLNTIHHWMTNLRRAVMVNRLRVGALGALAALLGVTVVILLAETLGHFSGSVRGVLLALWGVAAATAVGLGVIWPVLRYTVLAPDDQQLARTYAERMPTIRDRVLNALQLLERVEGANREGYSTELMLEAGREVAQELQPVDPRTLPDRKPVKRAARFALISGALSVVFLVFAGGSLLSAANRVLKPGEDFEPPAPFSLAIKPGNVTLVRGDSLVVEVTASGAVPPSITLERWEKNKNAGEPVTLRGENGIFRYTYRGVTTSFTYWAYEGRVHSEKYEATVQELPAVRFLSLRLTPPPYTGLAEQTLEENVGDVSAPQGTKVQLQLAATKSLKDAHLEFSRPDSTNSPSFVHATDVALTLDGSRASGEFTVQANGMYRIHLTDTEGHSNRDPILYRITARMDEAPTVALLEPAGDLEIAAGVQIAVVAEAMDDYGFSRMTLRYHRTSAFEPAEVQADEAGYQSLPLTFRVLEPGRVVSEYVWDLTPLDLLPEDQVVFFVEAWDNDAIHGSKRGKSVTRTLRFPSMTEIFEKQEQAAQVREISLADLMKESEELRKQVDEAVREYKSNPDLSWERKKEIEKLLEKQRAMSDMLNQVSDAMEKAAQQAQQRSMFSPEVMDKLKQVQELFKEVMTPEMQKALEKLAQAMKQPSEEEMRKAMENFQQTQEMFQKALDQALNVLKQLKMAKKLDELTRRLDELGRQQEQLNEKMDGNTPENAPKNAEQQKKLAEEMKKIENEARKLAEEMQKESAKGAQQMKELQQQMQQENLSEQMEQNQQAMSMCQNQSAKKKGRQARRKMSEFANEMQNIRKQMEQDENEEALAALERSRDQLLDLSMRQEKLWRESENLEPGSPQMVSAAEEQENLRQALQRVNEDLQELMRESMFVTPSLMAGMFNALSQMQQANAAAQSRDPRTAAHYRKQALSALNGALKENQNACSSCRNACNKPNPNSLCNNAGSMSKQQRQLRDKTSDLLSQCQNPGSLSPGEQAAMQRLASEQSALAKSAKELAQEAAASQQSLGKLDDVAKEMEEVAKDLENRNLSQRVIEKQEHIESRLLDFQRAAREREFSPKRQSTTGIDIVRRSPPALPDKPGQDQLRQDLLRALDTKYTPDYEQLIRAYFDALSKWK